MFCVIYQLCRVRGAKAVVRLMPHEAADLEPVIHALQAQVKTVFDVCRLVFCSASTQQSAPPCCCADAGFLLMYVAFSGLLGAQKGVVITDCGVVGTWYREINCRIGVYGGVIIK